MATNKPKEMYVFWEVQKDVFKSYENLTTTDIDYIVKRLKRELNELNKNVKERMEMLFWIENERSKRN